MTGVEELALTQPAPTVQKIGACTTRPIRAVADRHPAVIRTRVDTAARQCNMTYPMAATLLRPDALLSVSGQVVHHVQARTQRANPPVAAAAVVAVVVAVAAPRQQPLVHLGSASIAGMKKLPAGTVHM